MIRRPLFLPAAAAALLLSACGAHYPHADDPHYVPAFQYNDSADFGERGPKGVFATVAIGDDRVQLTGFSLERPTGLVPGSREAIDIDPDTRKFALVFDGDVPARYYFGLPGSSVWLPFTTLLDCHGKDRDNPMLTPCSSQWAQSTAIWMREFGTRRISALVSDAFDSQASAGYQTALTELSHRREAAAAAAAGAEQRRDTARVQRCGAMMTLQAARLEARRLADQAADRCAALGIDTIRLASNSLPLLSDARSSDGNLPQNECDGVQQEAAWELDLFQNRGVGWSQSATPYLFYLAATAACR